MTQDGLPEAYQTRRVVFRPDPAYRQFDIVSSRDDQLATEAEQDAFVRQLTKEGRGILRNLLWQLLFQKIRYDSWSTVTASEIDAALRPIEERIAHLRAALK